MNKLIHILIALYAIALWSCSSEKLSGNTTGTENPEITVSFVESGETSTVSGDLMVFYADQNPVLDPVPLIRESISHDSSSTLSWKTLDSVVMSNIGLAKAKEDVIWEYFNIVFISESFSGMIKDVMYDRKKRLFQWQGQTFSGDAENALDMQLNLFSLISKKYNLIWEDTVETPLYLFIPGSPFVSKIQGPNVEIIQYNDSIITPNVMTDDGKVYELEDFQSSPPTGAGGQDTIPVISMITENMVDSIIWDTVPEIILDEQYDIIVDTVYSVIPDPDSLTCGLRFPFHMMLHVVSENAVGGILSYETILWEDFIHLFPDTNFIFFYSNYNEELIVEVAKHTERPFFRPVQEGICAKQFSPKIQLDSIYILKDTSWEMLATLHLSGLVVDSITILGQNKKNPNDTVTFETREPDEDCPPPEHYFLIHWNREDSTWIDTLWYERRHHK